ncbi:hypothetical protein Sjap_011252 [Stephania japonica]|uniref:Uncharacterized protein n=1 Tax=Stephania japonica TaxID=461633 RepID=A0AAP0P791_9MAGN
MERGSLSNNLDNVGNKLNISEEYTEVICRSKSFTDLRSKAHHVQLRSTAIVSSSSSTIPSYTNILTGYLLEPEQHIITDMTKTSLLHHLIIEYFDGSFEASKLCGFLLQNIHETRVNYSAIQRVIRLTKRVVVVNNSNNSFDDHDNIIPSYSTYHFSKHQLAYNIFMELLSFIELSNPWASTNPILNFTLIRYKYKSMLNRLTVARDKMEKMVKFMRLMRFYDVSMRRVHKQLDAAAKGVYILYRDLDTIERLTRRLHDEVEHQKAIAALCVKNKEVIILKEVAREFKMHESCFLKQIGELEEHIYLCFLTINRSRRACYTINSI